MASPDPGWHEAMAQQAAQDNNGFARAFHQRCALAACDRLLAEHPRLAGTYLLRGRLRAQLFQFHEAAADNLAGLALGGHIPASKTPPAKAK